ncbi:hypothetical protein X975_14838, partial [Stegodyphus mimosarum]
MQAFPSDANLGRRLSLLRLSLLAMGKERNALHLHVKGLFFRKCDEFTRAGEFFDPESSKNDTLVVQVPR